MKTFKIIATILLEDTCQFTVEAENEKEAREEFHDMLETASYNSWTCLSTKYITKTIQKIEEDDKC